MATTELHTSKTVAIIGAGVSGLVACDVLKKMGFIPTVFERNNTVGGIWDITQYTNVSVQNCWPGYTIPGYPWKIKPDYFPTAKQIIAYFQSFVVDHELNVLLNHEVISTLQKPDNRWSLKIKDVKNQQETSQDFDYLMVATGQFSQTKSRDACFDPKQFVGQIITEQQVRDADSMFHNKKVVVVGNGKSALDMAALAAAASASQVLHIFRTPRWMIPRRICGIKYCLLLFPRISTIMIPSWGHPTLSERILHTVFFPLVWLFWKMLELVFTLAAYSNARSIAGFSRIRKTIPKRDSLVYHFRSAIALDTLPTSYYYQVGKGAIEPVHGEFEGFTGENTLVVKRKNASPKTVEADLVVLCTGVGRTPEYPFLQPEHRTLLENSNDGVQLYRHVIHPRITNFAIAGYNHSFLHLSCCVIGVVFTAAVWRNELELPKVEKMEACIERIRSYKRKNIAFEPSRACAVNTRFQQYLDILSLELKLSTWRKWPNVFAEFFAPYASADYDTIVEEYLRKAAKRAKRSKKRMLRCSNVDM
jgi:dimethylaniline monooxygenase (N-oxide forming)